MIAAFHNRVETKTENGIVVQVDINSPAHEKLMLEEFSVLSVFWWEWLDSIPIIEAIPKEKEDSFEETAKKISDAFL